MSGSITTLRAGLATALVSLLLAGCADTDTSGLIAGSATTPDGAGTASTAPAASGKTFADALALEERGERKKAYAAISLAYAAEPSNPDVVVAYCRLALGSGRAEDASKALAAAEASGMKDWRILSAKGAVLAEKGDLKGAKVALQQGLALSPEQPALLNNLAFVYALEGEPKMAEDLLRRASTAPGAKPRTRQNLALVLGLQGKFDESKKIAAADTSPEIAEANIAYLRGLAQTKGSAKLAKAGG